ncbi:MAG: MaoC family dehydratase [Halobacteriaceae archaeon]
MPPATGDGSGLSVGERVAHETRVTADDVAAFAGATGDASPLHTERAAAEDAGFDGPVVHGALLLGVAGGALASLPGTPVLREQTATFERPAAVGDAVTAVCTLRERSRGGREHFDLRIEGPDGTVLVTGSVVAVWGTGDATAPTKGKDT